MAITISGENNNDKILAADGVIDQISGINIVGVLTATTFEGNLTGNVTGNLTGNVNSTSPLLLQTGGSERFRITGNNELGIAGANYGSSGQVLTSGGSGSAVTWSAIPSQANITNNADNRVITGGSGVNLNGEANLTFNGTTLDLNGTANILKSDSSGFHVLIRNTNNTNGNQAELRFQGTTSSNTAYTTARIVATNLDNYNQYSDLRFFTHSLGSTTEKLRIDYNGDLRFNTADGIIRTGADTSRLRLFGGSSNSTTNGAALALHGVNHSAGNYAVLASGNGGFIRFSTGATPRLHITSDGTVLHGSGAIATQKASNGGFDISCNTHSLVIGADSNTGNLSQARTNNANKDGRIGHVHYTNAEEPIGIVRVSSTSSENTVFIGGGSSLFNAATSLQFYTAANNTTTNGTLRGMFTSAGNLALGNTHGAKKVHISTTGNQKILIDPNYNNNSGGSSNSEADANNIVESILIRTSFGSNAASQTNAGHKWGIKFQGYNGNDFTQAISKCAGVFAVSEDEAGGYNRNVGLAFHTSPYNTNHREVMRINTNGIVTKPYQYAFLAVTANHQKSANWSKITDHSLYTSQCTGVADGTYWSNSTQRFTAPVTGVYNFYVGGWSYGNSNGSRYAYSFKHQNDNTLNFIGGGDYCTSDSPMAGWSRVIKLTAGEWIELWGYSVIAVRWGGGHRFFWGGYLLG